MRFHIGDGGKLYHALLIAGICNGFLGTAFANPVLPRDTSTSSTGISKFTSRLRARHPGLLIQRPKADADLLQTTSFHGLCVKFCIDSKHSLDTFHALDYNHGTYHNPNFRSRYSAL